MLIAPMLVAVLVAGGCADDDAPESREGSGASASVTPTPSPSPTSSAPTSSASATAAPTDDLPFPGVAPADGLRLQVDGASVQVPQGWERDPSFTGLDQGAVGPDAFVQLIDQATVDFGAVGLGDLTTEELEEFVLMSLDQGSQVRYRLREPLQIGGQTVVHATGTDRTGSTTEVFQALRGDRFVTVTVIGSEDGATPLSELVPAVLNSWTWG